MDKLMQEVKALICRFPDLVEKMDLLRINQEMQFFSERDNMYAIARSLGFGTEIYFDAGTGWLANAGGQWSFTYNVPDYYVDIAESLGWDPSAARIMKFEWVRDGKTIYTSNQAVRREKVRVYPFSDEAFDYCKVTITNNDAVNEQFMNVWGYCHFISTELYKLLKQRMTEHYPYRLFPELKKIIKRPKL